MRKILYSLIAVMLLSFYPDANAASLNVLPSGETLSILESSESKGKIKKRKLKKTVRKAGRVYRKIKTDSDSRKKSRQVQRKVRSIINIF